MEQSQIKGRVRNDRRRLSHLPCQERLKAVQTCAFAQGVLDRVERPQNRVVLYHHEPAAVVLQQRRQVLVVVFPLDVQHTDSVAPQLDISRQQSEAAVESSAFRLSAPNLLRG